MNGLQALERSNVRIDGKLEFLYYYMQAYPHGVSPNYLSTKTRSFFFNLWVIVDTTPLLA